MVTAVILAVVVRVVPAVPDAPAHVTLALDQDRTIRVATNTGVDAGGAKTIQVVDRGWWSPVVQTSDKAQIDVPLWPAAELKGMLTVEKGVEAPRELEAAFDLRRERVTIRCSIDANAWTCTLPKTKLDIRLAANGFVPHYLWDVDLAQTPPVPITLKRGASVAGWVSAARDDVSLETATVTLRPATYGEPDDQSLLAFKAKPNKRGFFQFAGVAAGRWLVVAEAPDLSPSPVTELEVDDRNETTLRDALELRDLADLIVSIKPAVDSRGLPWRVRLNRRDPRSRYQDRVAESSATEMGEWSHGRLAAGEYDLEILDARGSARSTTRIAVVPGIAPVQIAIARVPVKGRIRIGGNGVAAILKFSSGRGEHVSATSTEDGEFTLDVPFEGKWRVDVRLRKSRQELSPRDVKIARKDGEPDAYVNLDLPGGRIAGRVVDESGKSVKAGVILSRNGSILADILAEDGAFELIGVEPGLAMIEAQAPGASSGLLPVNIDPATSAMTLTLRRWKKLEGFVMTAAGDPVAGASVRYIRPGAGFGGQIVTSPSGRFVIDLDSDTTEVRLAIAAPGLPSKLALLRVPDDKRAVDIVVGRASGRLIIPLRDRPPPWPTLGRDGAWASVLDLVAPHFGGGPPPWATRQGTAIDLEPGEYTLCPTHIPSSDCVQQIVSAGAITIADTPRRQGPKP